jgi:guanylate cyclase
MQRAVRQWLLFHSKQLLDLAGNVGLDVRDNDERALRKRVAVVLFGGTLPLTIAWSATYLALGAPRTAAIPAFYSVFTPVNMFIFARTRDLEIFRFTQLFLVLMLPWLVMISLGGFRQSSAVIMWAALSPLGALLVDDLRRTIFWIVGFVALLIAGAILEPYLQQAILPEIFIRLFFVLNIGVVISITFALL